VVQFGRSPERPGFQPPDLTGAEIAAKCDHALGRGWSVADAFTDDPRPRNT
jgi:ribulose bisphosphate carboxylase small subunit